MLTWQREYAIMLDMKRTSTSQKIAAEILAERSECGAHPLDALIFQTGPKEEMLQYARQTSLGSTMANTSFDDKPKAESLVQTIKED
jgi:hypothetical protein